MNNFCLTPTFFILMVLSFIFRSLLFPSYVRYYNFNILTAPKDEKFIFLFTYAIEIVLIYLLFQLNTGYVVKNIILWVFILFAQVLPQVTINAYRNHYKKN